MKNLRMKYTWTNSLLTQFLKSLYLLHDECEVFHVFLELLLPILYENHHDHFYHEKNDVIKQVLLKSFHSFFTN